MKLLKKDLKHGVVKVMPESADDLWYLSTIIEPGDRCTGQSEYKYKLESSGKTVKKKVWVSLEVEKTEFSSSLRVSGKVVAGSEEVPRGSYHSLDVTEGFQLEIQKEWLDYHREKLDEAVKSAKLKTLLVLFDREAAVFVMLKPSGHDVLLEMKGSVPKKGMDEGKTKSFYKEIVAQLEEYCTRYKVQRAVAASPSFWNEYLKKELPSELQKKVIFAAVSAAEVSAIPELLKRPELQQALAGERAAREEAIVAEIMDALGKEKLSYGFADVTAAVGEGNVKSLTVTENEITKRREEGTFAELDALMKQASSMKAVVQLLSTDAMQQIDGLGGVVAVHRW
ncbi:MAG: hypothetical protein OXR66_06365 [Candidatus Woesearchaeota archaeon]|nr:hypothetical protein [Candidatus Woesearchaeota archaeon]